MLFRALGSGRQRPPANIDSCRPTLDIKIASARPFVESAPKMVFINGLMGMEHQIVVDAVDALFARGGIIIPVQAGQGGVKLIQPGDEFVPDRFVPFPVGVHPWLVVVLVKFLQKVEQLAKIHFKIDCHRRAGCPDPPKCCLRPYPSRLLWEQPPIPGRPNG